MTTETLTKEQRINNLLDVINNAKSERSKARARMDNAKTNKARREAEEDLNFWQGKVNRCEINLKYFIESPSGVR